MAHLPTRSRFQNVQFAYIKQSSSRDVSESFADVIVLIIYDARYPALDTIMVSRFALANSHSLRGIDLFDTIPGLKLLKKQNSFLVNFDFIFNHPRKYFLNTMSFRHDQR